MKASQVFRVVLAILLLAAGPARALTKDDPVIPFVNLDRLEVHDADEGRPLVWKGSAGLSGDLWGLHLTSEGERLDGVTEEGEVEVRVRRALSAFWNLELGWRRDFQPRPERDWAAFGLDGVLPYHIETEVSLYADDAGDTAARFEAHHELRFTQRLVLRSAVELDAYGQDNRLRGLGAGLAHLEAGLRLGYELRREISPYVGVEYKRVYDGTADLHRAAGEALDETVLVGGVRVWY
jgi:copper resistance protein B